MRLKQKKLAYKLVNNLLNDFFGLKISRSFTSFDSKRNQLINDFGISLAIDGGANSGQWAVSLRKQNKNIQIHSFEPINDLFKKLEKMASRDSHWYVYNFALGSAEAKSKINLASNEFMSSSILKPREHLSAFPEIKFNDSQDILVRRLDSFNFQENNSFLLLKLDVQGFEFEALQGSIGVIDRVAILEIETSFWPMYEGEKSHSEILNFLENLGFRLVYIGEPLIDDSGRIGYLDCLLINSNIYISDTN